jgi:hypothetical protein
MPDYNTLKDIATIAIAVAGLGLSIFNFSKAHKKDKRQIDVKLVQAIAYVGNDVATNTCIVIKATNLGHRPVRVTVLAIELPNLDRLVTHQLSYGPLVNDKLPLELTDGHSAEHYISHRQLNHELVLKGYQGKIKIRAICEDSASNAYRGKTEEFECGMYQYPALN